MEYLAEEEEEGPEINQVMLNEVVQMGIPELAAKHSLVKTQNASSDMAVAYYFDHMNDPELMEPIGRKKKGGGASEESILQLMEMGFSRERVVCALRECVLVRVTSRTTQPRGPSSTCSATPRRRRARRRSKRVRC